MEPRVKLWIERDGHIALSDYRVRLLGLVRDTGSLSQAAARMRLSYRRAWGKIKEIEENLGIALVESEAGGAGGGHTRLTPEGELLVRRYRELHERIARAVRDEYAAIFADVQLKPHPAAGPEAATANRS